MLLTVTFRNSVMLRACIRFDVLSSHVDWHMKYIFCSLSELYTFYMSFLVIVMCGRVCFCGAVLLTCLHRFWLFGPVHIFFLDVTVETVRVHKFVGWVLVSMSGVLGNRLLICWMRFTFRTVRATKYRFGVSDFQFSVETSVWTPLLVFKMITLEVIPDCLSTWVCEHDNCRSLEILKSVNFRFEIESSSSCYPIIEYELNRPARIDSLLINVSCLLYNIT